MNILLITIALYIGQSLVLKYSFISCLFYYSITRFYIFIGLFLQYLRFCAVPFIFISFFSLDSAYSQTNSDGKIFIEAEKVFYDHGKDTVLASGNVHVIKDNNMIMGDYLLYDRINNIIKMNGNIASVHQDKTVIFADKIKLSLKDYTGGISNVGMRLSNNFVLASNRAEMLGQNKYKLYNVVASSCKVCEDNLITNVPLWQIRSKEVMVDKEKQEMHYSHARIEFLKAPIFYTPYLTTPMPGSGKKSGFLAPRIKFDQRYGTEITTPYYYVISPTQDFTFSPHIRTNSPSFYGFELRDFRDKWEYQASSSITRSIKVDSNGNQIPGKKEYRGHIDLIAKYRLINTSMLGINGKYLFDKTKTYLKDYDISHEDILNTKAYWSKCEIDKYSSMEHLGFQDLRPTINVSTTPYVLPSFRYNYTKKIDHIIPASNLSLVSEVSYVHREEGPRYQKLYLKPSMITNFRLLHGQRLYMLNTASGYLFHIKQITITPSSLLSSINTGDVSTSGAVAKLHPSTSIIYDWPWKKRFSGGNTVVITPIVNLTVAPQIKYYNLYYDEAVQGLSLSSMFSPYYNGINNEENGSSVKYGLSTRIEPDYLKSIELTIGNKVNLNKMSDANNYVLPNSLYYNDNYLTKLYTEFTDSIYAINRNWFANNKLMQNEIDVGITLPKWNIASYHIAFSKNNVSKGFNGYLQEFGIFASYNIYREWWGGINGKRNLGRYIGIAVPNTRKTKWVSTGAVLSYKNQCLTLDFGITKNYLQLRDMKPSITYSFSINVPMVGGI